MHASCFSPMQIVDDFHAVHLQSIVGCPEGKKCNEM